MNIVRTYLARSGRVPRTKEYFLADSQNALVRELID